MKPNSEDDSYNLIEFMEVYHDRKSRRINWSKTI